VAVPTVSFTFFSMLSEDRALSLAEIAKKSPVGEFWDVGCNGGGSAAIMKEAVPTSFIRLFDSFEGLPACTEEDGDYGREKMVGEFTIPYQDFLRRLGTVHSGWVPETFKGLEDSKISLAHVDLDYYKGTKAALEFILPRIVLGGYVVVDDYDSNWAGVKPATDEVMTAEFVKIDAPPEQAIFKRIR
jgi:O-methyltransferase